MSPVRKLDIKEIESLLNNILNIKAPPVARCRLLSSGLSPNHAINIAEDISGHKECLGCGNCIDVCPVLARESSRLQLTEQRSSMALENTVGEDCDQCYACVISCPQVDVALKHYVVNHRVIETISRLSQNLGDEDDLDLLYEETASPE
jgi:ferredoxin